MADTIKCPNCSANLRFDADLQKLTCDFCGSDFLPDDKAITDIAQHLYGDDSTDDGSAIVENPGVAESEASASRGMADEPEIEYDDSTVQELRCNSCGAIVIADNSTSATYCAFCGSPAIVTQRLSSKFAPRYIIPFKYGKEAAVDKFFKWCKGGRFAPMGFVSDKNIEKITGLYVPFWLFDIDGSMRITASGVTVKSENMGSQTKTTTSYFSIVRKGKFQWKRIPLDGATRIDDDLMEAVEPYDYKDLVKYNPAYLPGFFADKYDLTDEDLKERIVKRANDYITEEFVNSTNKYSKVSITSNTSRLGEPKAMYALLPVWFLHYRYLGKDYDFAMNGQTGEVAGVPPVSKIKKLVLFFLLLGLGSVVMRLIAGVLLGVIAG